MIRTVFADTGYWIALFDKRDWLHTKVVAVTKHLKDARIVTSQMVLTEFLNIMSKRGESMRKLAVSAVRDLLEDPRFEVVIQSDELFHAALKRYAERSDKKWSLTDCASFLIMEKLKIEDALAHDHHFEQAQFNSLLRKDFPPMLGQDRQKPQYSRPKAQ